MKDARQRFTAAARDYARHRPGYPAALREWLLAPFINREQLRVLDLATGTGISARFLAEDPRCQVLGLDPNQAMLEEARRAGGPVIYRRGEAAHTGLEDRSVDLVLAAQAFHWFPLEESLREIRRVLAPGGLAAACWNERGHAPLLDEYEALLRAQVAGYAERPRHADSLAVLRGRLSQARELALDHTQALDWEGFRGRVYSSSYVVHDVRDRAAFDAALAALFTRHARDGRVELSYRTLAIAWR